MWSRRRRDGESREGHGSRSMQKWGDGFTSEEFARLTHGLIFEMSNGLVACVGFGELAQKELDPSHPAYAHVTRALKAAERLSATVKQCETEVRHRDRKRRSRRLTNRARQARRGRFPLRLVRVKIGASAKGTTRIRLRSRSRSIFPSHPAMWSRRSSRPGR